jgi:soluble lytic murein transglycosylase-like protein
VDTALQLACSRSLQRSALRRATAARRRTALRALALGTVTCLVFLASPAPVEPAANALRPGPQMVVQSPMTCGVPQRFVPAFRAAAAETGLPLPLLSAVAWEESRMDPRARSQAGAEGLLQVLPTTAATVAVADNGPRANVLAGARYLLQMLDRFGDLELALAAYNAGPTAVQAAGGAPTVATLRYAKNIEARAAVLSGCA